MSEAPDIYRIYRRLTWALSGTSIALGLVVGWDVASALETSMRRGDVARAVLLLVALGGVYWALWTARRELTRLIVFHQYVGEHVRVVALELPHGVRIDGITVAVRRTDGSTLN